MQNKKTIILPLFVLFLFALVVFSCNAQTNKNAAPSSYYQIPVVWDSGKNTVALDGGESAVKITKENLLQDSGSGSQFYARVIDFANKPKVFSGKDAKLFLGQWKTEGDAKTAKIKITVPYFTDGYKVVIFSAKDKKAALTVPVAKFARIKKAATAQNKNTAVTPPAKAQYQGPVAYSLGGSTWVGWVLVIVVLAALGGGGYFIWRWRKKKKMQEAENVVNLTQK